jgi:hypothetical protein
VHWLWPQPLSIGDLVNDGKKKRQLQQYWWIKIPIALFPKPKFYLGQQVGVPWEDEQGDRYYDIGIIVGMQYAAFDDSPSEWYYRLHIIRSDSCPWQIGFDRDYFEPESSLVTDDTAIED